LHLLDPRKQGVWRPKKTSFKRRILRPTGEFTLHRIFVSLESSPFSLKQINFFVKKRKRKERRK
jgi:hypothetical protein